MSVEEFIRRWLHHVLPSGFHRVRHYGFMNTRSKRTIEEVRWLVSVALECVYLLGCTEQIVMADPLSMMCPACGGAMICLGYTPPPTPLTGSPKHDPRGPP